ncbi:hypothetical protein HFN89_06055 [Rhizobium laguerreae]|nr:hypothetical protein [Rhizobium laguerreae]
MTTELTDLQQRLVDSGYVMLVGKKSDEIAEKDRQMILRGFAGTFGNKGLACTILRDDGHVLIVNEGDISASSLRHEFIHAAQCFAGHDVMASCLAAAVEVGRPLVEAIRASVAEKEDTNRDHRDLETTEKLWRNHVAGKNVSPDFVDFQFFQDLYPTKETAALAAEILGFDYPRGAYAAMTAYLCAEVGHQIDPYSDFAREIVAYTFEMRESDVVDELMVDAADNLDAKLRRNVGAPLCAARP